MIPLVVRPGAKLPLSPTTFCVLPRGMPIRSRCVLVIAELDGIIVLPLPLSRNFHFSLPPPHICASVRSETLTAVTILLPPNNETLFRTKVRPDHLMDSVICSVAVFEYCRPVINPSTFVCDRLHGLTDDAL